MIEVGKFLNLERSTVFGKPIEGGPATFNSTGFTIAAYLLGATIPKMGDYLVAHYEGNRWVVERATPGSGGGSVGYINSCFCSPIPALLTMTSLDQNCNYKMFQSCSIQYQSTPACYASLSLPPMIFLSSASFPDLLAGNAMFQYYLICTYNTFSLTRLYCTSPYGSPYRDGVLYTWQLGGTENTCTPFQLHTGVAFPGSDLSCVVRIDG